VLFAIFKEHRFELRMNRALAAVHHDGEVEQPVELIEHDIVVGVERIGADGVRSEIGFDIVPIGAGAADCGRGRSEFGIGVGRAQQ
jgi:hypothetical protein